MIAFGRYVHENVHQITNCYQLVQYSMDLLVWRAKKVSRPSVERNRLLGYARCTTLHLVSKRERKIFPSLENGLAHITHACATGKALDADYVTRWH